MANKNSKKSTSPQPTQQQIQVTLENAPKLTVHFLERIYGRLGYLIKILEEGKK